MNKSEKKVLQLDKAKVEKLMQNWKNCLPGNLSNLFYKSSKKKGIQRISYFSLDLPEDVEGIVNYYNETPNCVIRILMGCDKKKGQEVFTPVFALRSKDDASAIPLYLTLTPRFGNNTPEPIMKFYTYFNLDHNQQDENTQITGGVADLFHKKWSNQTDQELANAFHGISQENLLIQPESPLKPLLTTLLNLRVNFYEYTNVDTGIIIQYIKNIPNNSNSKEKDVRMYMGAGLSVLPEHPFSFRPMLFLLNRPSGMPMYNTDASDDPGSGTYFERSHPCPPYCEPPED